MRISEINTLEGRAFAAFLDGVFEHSTWIAERARAGRPFASVSALHAEMMRCLHEATREEQLALVRSHPELAGKEAASGILTENSSNEQGRLGFTALSRTELERMAALNRRYRVKFGFPCIVALKLHAYRDSVIAEMERRIANDAETELNNALEQIGYIARARLERLLENEE
jgi:OHCU decarboxylase